MLYPLTRMMWVDEPPKKVAVGGGGYRYDTETQSLVKYVKYVDVVGSIYKNYMFITSVHSRLLQKYRLFIPVMSNIYAEFLNNFKVSGELFKEYISSVEVHSQLFDMKWLDNIKEIESIKELKHINDVKLTKYLNGVKLLHTTKLFKNSVLIDKLEDIRRKELLDTLKIINFKY